jgi:hypothetical protein
MIEVKTAYENGSVSDDSDAAWRIGFAVPEGISLDLGLHKKIQGVPFPAISHTTSMSRSNIFREASKPRHPKSLARRVNARAKRSAISSRRTGSVTRISIVG